MRTHRSVELSHACAAESMEHKRSPGCITPRLIGPTDPYSSNRAIQAAIRAAKQQKRRPRSLCSVGNSVPPLHSPGSRGGLLNFLKQRSGRRCEPDGDFQMLNHALSHRPLSMSVLEINRLDGVPERGSSGPGGFSRSSSGFLRGTSLWSSQRWNVFGSRASDGSVERPPRRNLTSSLRKSFSFRLRRGPESRREGERRDSRVRSRSEGDACSLHTASSRRDLFSSEPLARSRETGHTSLWKLLTSPFRKKEFTASSARQDLDCRRATEPVLVGVTRTEIRERRGMRGKQGKGVGCG
ncbi:uncharacterized protein LOC142475797 [Ascaphus truei]|uniref:uncharacterized protein LOC142475797 n=1 Tax=Ascaphus truei TaxID=8439 RepID=UPI003F59E80F